MCQTSKERGRRCAGVLGWVGGGVIKTKPRKEKRQKKEEVPFMLFILVLFQRAPCYLGELP